jgi:hypothetical protein
LLAWTVYALALIHTALLFTITDLAASSSLLIQLLYPLGMAGAAIIMLYAAALHEPGPRRWAWILQTCSLLCGVVAVDQRRVLRALHQAQQQADHAATQTQDFLARIVHDIAAPLQGLRTVVDQQPL